MKQYIILLGLLSEIKYTKTMHKMYLDGGDKICTDWDEKQVIYFTWPKAEFLQLITCISFLKILNLNSTCLITPNYRWKQLSSINFEISSKSNHFRTGPLCNSRHSKKQSHACIITSFS